MSNSLRTLILSLFLIPSIYTTAQNDSLAYPSLLWEITGNGLSDPSYLYGTMHVSDKVAFHLGPEFLNAIESADVVALELNPEHWMEDIQNSELYAANEELTNLNNNNSRGFYVKAFKISPPDNKDIGQHLQTNDGLVNQLLYRTSGYDSDFEEKTYLDLYIFQTGKKLGKEVFSLEDFDEVERLSIKAMMPDEDTDEEEVRKKYRKLYSSGINMQQELEDAYRTGNLDMVDSLSKMSNVYPGFQKYMVVQRNQTMADGMDSIMQNKRLFTGVGAAHLPGEEGVIEMLRKKGYNLKPVERTIGGKSKVLEKKIDKQVFPVTFKSFTAPDGSFKADLPGPMYEMYSSQNAKVFMYPEMVNGTYFWAKRVQTYASLIGQDEDFMKKRLDSLLYENIPGEIVKQKMIETNGFMGYDIINSTGKNNTQRYQIYILPSELLIFKMGGTGDYVTKYGKQFFNSLELFPDRTSTWKNYQPAGGLYKVDIPGEAVEMSFQPDFITMAHNEVHSYDFEKDQRYMIYQTFLNDVTYLEEDDYEYYQLLESLREDLSYETQDSVMMPFQGSKALRFSMKHPERDGILEGLIARRGQAYYLVASFGGNEEDADRFISSFAFEKPTYVAPFRILEDTSLHYSVKTIFNDMSQEVQGMSGAMGSMFGIDEGEPEDFEGKVEERTFGYSKTGDQIMLEYVKYHEYAEFANVDSLWSFNIDLLVDTLSTVVTELPALSTADVDKRMVQVTDTATSSSILYQMMIQDGQFFGITTQFDTLDGLSEFQETFFSTFSPADSVVGSLPFGKRGSKFLTELNSGDSALVHRSIKSFGLVSFESSDSEGIRTLVDGFDFENLDQDKYPEFSQINLLARLGEFDNEANRSFLRESYLNNEEDLQLQLTCLEALARHKSKRSLSTLVELMLDMPPPVDNSYELWGIYRPVEDSMELAKPFLPKLFKLNSIEEYRLKNYWLLSHMYREDLVVGNDYKGIKDEIMLHAKNELRKSFAKEGSQLKSGDFSEGYGGPATNYDLIRMVELLLPWKNEAKVKAMVDKLKTTQNPRLRIDVAEMLLRNDIEPEEDFLVKEEKDLSRLTQLYDNLKELDRLDFASDSVFSQENFAKAALLGYQVSKEDSIVFVAEHLLETRLGMKRVYYFKVKSEDAEADIWTLYASHFQPEDKSEFNSFSETVRMSEIDEDDFSETEQIKKQNEILSNTGRPRYRFRGKSQGSIYDFYDR